MAYVISYKDYCNMQNQYNYKAGGKCSPLMGRGGDPNPSSLMLMRHLCHCRQVALSGTIPLSQYQLHVDIQIQSDRFGTIRLQGLTVY
jgi:hypothetical protein